MLSELTALSPLDGRYWNTVEDLAHFFSEAGLMAHRVEVEVEWLKFLSECKEISEVRSLTKDEQKLLEKIKNDFDEPDALRIKEIEKTTNHDVKAVEYFLKEKLQSTSLEELGEWVHFACTSEDINNLSYALMMRNAVQNETRESLLSTLENLQKFLEEKSVEWKSAAMLARTHGQPASPTTMGKVWLNFSQRLKRQIGHIKNQEYLGKMNGATGNFNAHAVAYPKVEWMKLSQKFVESLGLTWQGVTDQIEPHDFIAEICHNWMRVNAICIDFARDVWGYISLGYFSQQLKKGEVGSSTMPHKVNPIDFENAEGNAGVANALFGHFAEKLPISRWQRDLSDSTVMRNIGIAFGHTYLVFKSLEKGVGKLEINTQKIKTDLEENWAVLAEAAQTVMRKYNIEKPYEKLKELTRGKKLTPEKYKDFVTSLEIPEDAKKNLMKLTPMSYTGIAEKIVDQFAT